MDNLPVRTLQINPEPYFKIINLKYKTLHTGIQTDIIAKHDEDTIIKTLQKDQAVSYMKNINATDITHNILYPVFTSDIYKKH